MEISPEKIEPDADDSSDDISHHYSQISFGWFFERQSGDVLTYETLAKAADLNIDLSFDVYPPTQRQNEYEISDDIPPP